MKTTLQMKDTDTETTKKVELLNDGRITQGGIFTQGRSIAGITFTTCTFSK
jgi:hypothetical protein